MTPEDSIQRLHKLGGTLELADLPFVERLHINEEAALPEHADLVASMSPRTVTLNGSLMNAQDIPSLLQFVSLQAIVAHRFNFANALLRTTANLSDLQSIAMSHTNIVDADVSALENRSGIRSIHFAGTELSDASMKVFGTLPDLELIDLRDTSVTKEGLLHLRDLRHLLTINVSGTAITDQQANWHRDNVKSLLPDLEVLT